MRGQAFTTFKLLIGAVLAVGLLLIASAVTLLMGSPYSGMQTARDLVLEAKKAPGLCFSRDNAAFSQDEPFTQNTNVFGQSISTQISVVESPPLSSGKLTQAATVPLSAKCTSTTACTLWFNKAAC